MLGRLKIPAKESGYDCYGDHLSIVRMFFFHVICIEILFRYYFECCRDGEYRQNKQPRVTSKKRPHQKPTRKINEHCISRMYVDEFTDLHVEVTYISAHTGHELGTRELPFLPLPVSTKEEVARKICQGVTQQRVLDGKTKVLYSSQCTCVHI